MFCGKCGQPLNGNMGCLNCNSQYNYNKNNKNQIIIGMIIACCLLIVAVAYILLTSDNESVYFSDDNNINSSGNTTSSSKISNSTNKQLGVTIVEYNNQYYIEEATTENIILNKVRDDSESQKITCDKKIIEIEKRIIENYQIEAVNLCELDVEFAKEIENIVKYIYNEYPSARGYLTHISLGNINMTNTIAFFQWVAPFTFSNSDDLMGYKSRIILNSSFYLNENKFKQTVLNSSANGHFPKNATIYSPFAHEFGHYLSFVATNNYYSANPKIIYDAKDTTSGYILAILDFNKGEHSKRMAEEAYENYKFKTNTTMTFDEFRASISSYAVAKDSTGAYIYDETIAEAFHDVYLNGDNAALASKEIMLVLRKYLEM